MLGLESKQKECWDSLIGSSSKKTYLGIISGPSHQTEPWAEVGWDSCPPSMSSCIVLGSQIVILGKQSYKGSRNGRDPHVGGRPSPPRLCSGSVPVSSSLSPGQNSEPQGILTEAPKSFCFLFFPPNIY